jgi:hypothetical protein
VDGAGLKEPGAGGAGGFIPLLPGAIAHPLRVRASAVAANASIFFIGFPRVPIIQPVWVVTWAQAFSLSGCYASARGHKVD